MFYFSFVCIYFMYVIKSFFDNVHKPLGSKSADICRLSSIELLQFVVNRKERVSEREREHNCL